jgi:hypothetical protein
VPWSGVWVLSGCGCGAVRRGRQWPVGSAGVGVGVGGVAGRWACRRQAGRCCALRDDARCGMMDDAGCCAAAAASASAAAMLYALCCIYAAAAAAAVLRAAGGGAAGHGGGRDLEHARTQLLMSCDVYMHMPSAAYVPVAS